MSLLSVEKRDSRLPDCANNHHDEVRGAETRTVHLGVGDLPTGSTYSRPLIVSDAFADIEARRAPDVKSAADVV